MTNNKTQSAGVEELRAVVLPVIGACLLMRPDDPKLADPRLGVATEVANAVVKYLATLPQNPSAAEGVALVGVAENACSNPDRSSYSQANTTLREMFAETAILLTHSDPQRQAKAKERVYALLFNADPNTTPAQEPDGLAIGNRCSLCHTSAPEAFAKDCNRPECPHRSSQPLPDRSGDLLPGLDHIANFLNALDTEGMTAKDVRSAVYSECLEPGCKSALRGSGDEGQSRVLTYEQMVPTGELSEAGEVERVAYAIWAKDWPERYGAVPAWHHVCAEDEDTADRYRDLARAAIAALRPDGECLTLLRKCREAIKAHALQEDYDYPGDTAVYAGTICQECFADVDGNPHKPTCVLSKLDTFLAGKTDGGVSG